MAFDNQPGKYNAIVHPDPYMMVEFMQQIKNNLCMNVNNIPWREKKNQVYFHGAITGEAYDFFGNFSGRLKLMHLANQNPDLIYFGLSTDKHNFNPDDIPD